ncbi:NarK family nitrate/nitrite MFS transporter [Entomobacter blattae]|uniref:Nitrate/nitrite transporter n=1 Tax=Entomobacter blattae TaxID=2762277 RepID=A0A7H1NNY6_9PROT|nr:NarK family nitrate/nitrite MFS transporter [Entomobacter blattae]QNT77496.1 Nitrate/nitrite transporter NarK [Entomobacter blattae]
MSQTSSSGPSQKSSGSIKVWNPEDPVFWETQGHKVASRNLWISVFCLFLAFCVWMLFSAVTVRLNAVGFNFTNQQLFLLTALPSITGAVLRVPYSFAIPIFGGRRWTAYSTAFLIIPCLWLGFAVQNKETSLYSFAAIALLCGLGGANFASSMSNISFFFPKAKQGSALGINGGLGNLGVSVMQFVVPLAISYGLFSFLGGEGVPQSNGSVLWMENAAWIWIPFLVVASLAAWFGMNDLATSKASFSEMIPILWQKHMWILSILYLSTFGSFIGFSAGFAMLTKTQFPEVSVLQYVFIGPLLGALARSVGGVMADRFGGVRVTGTNFIIMVFLTIAVFFTLPSGGEGGSFAAFFTIFMLLFLTAGLGSGSAFQMIAVVFRRFTFYRIKNKGGSDNEANRVAITDTASALGFISAIGAIGGFFIPKAFSYSLSLTGSPAGALKIFLVFYVACIVITWFIYGKDQFMTKSQK